MAGARTTPRVRRGLFVAVDGLVVAAIAVFVAGAAGVRRTTAVDPGDLEGLAATLAAWLATPGVGPFELVAYGGLAAALAGPTWYWLVGPLVVARRGGAVATADEPEVFVYDDENAEDDVDASQANQGVPIEETEPEGSTDWERLLGLDDADGTASTGFEFIRGGPNPRLDGGSLPTGGAARQEQPPYLSITEVRKLSSTSGPKYNRPPSRPASSSASGTVEDGETSEIAEPRDDIGDRPASPDATETDASPGEASPEEIVEALFMPAAETEDLTATDEPAEPAVPDVEDGDPAEDHDRPVREDTDDGDVEPATPDGDPEPTTEPTVKDDPEDPATGDDENAVPTAVHDRRAPEDADGDTSVPATADEDREPSQEPDAEGEPDDPSTDDDWETVDPLTRLSIELEASRSRMAAVSDRIAAATRENGTGHARHALAAAVADADERVAALSGLEAGPTVDLPTAIEDICADQRRIEDAVASALPVD